MTSGQSSPHGRGDGEQVWLTESEPVSLLGLYETAVKTTENKEKDNDSKTETRLTRLDTQNPLEPIYFCKTPHPSILSSLSKTIRYYAGGARRRRGTPTVFQNITRRGLILFLQPISQKDPDCRAAAAAAPPTTHYSQPALLLRAHTVH